MIAAPSSTDTNNDLFNPDTNTLRRSMTLITDDSTALPERSSTSDQDSVAVADILPPGSCAKKDQPLESLTTGGDRQLEQVKHFTLTVVPEDDISKSAVIVEDQDQDGGSGSPHMESDLAPEDEYISNKLFHLRHGFTKEEFALPVQNDDIALDAVQELRLIQRPLTANFAFLVDQLQFMKTAAVALQFKDADIIEGIAEKCARVLERHQIFDQILELRPSQGEAVKALYSLVTASYDDTKDLVKNWSPVYHILQELVERISSLTDSTTDTPNSGASGKSPKLRRSLFSKKPNASQIQLPSEALQYKRDVCNNWASQMRAFKQIMRTYRFFAGRTTEFAFIKEIEALEWYCGDEFNSTFENAQTEFSNTKELSRLHYQIDYTNLQKALPKENALTTAEERRACPPRPLFTRDRQGSRRLIREGRLTEFVSLSPATGSNKKNVSPPSPKEYQLVVLSDMIYLCEIVPVSSRNETDKGSKKTNSKSLHHKPLRLVHEPVPVIDSQISSTPDIVHPPLVQKNLVMVCFFNQTSYILQAESSEERDAWVECARQLNIEQPKPSDACREQDESDEIKRCASAASFSTTGKSKGSKMSLIKRLKNLRRSAINLVDEMGPISEIDPDQLTRTEEEENARRMQLGQPSQWEVRRLPLDLGVIPPLEHPIPFRKSHLYDTCVTIVDLTTGKTAPGEFGMGIEDRAAYFRDECALFAVLRPARLIPHNEIDRQRDDFFLCCKRLHRGEVMFVEPPYITDFYARSWLHPDLKIEFEPESSSVMIANMYRIICSTSDIVTEFQKYHTWLMKNAKISPDNTFLSMDYRSHPLRIAKKIVGSNTGSVFEGGREYTDLGECNVEFRRMSNAPDALSVGFYNPGTKRDMAVGVMMFDKIKVKATASSLGLTAFHALGPSNGVVRMSPTEMSLTLWQTDARTRPTYIKGQRVFETVKSKSLDTFKVTGQREALNELEDFMRARSGTDCKTRDLDEIFDLAQIAFQDEVMDDLDEEHQVHHEEEETEVMLETIDTPQEEVIIERHTASPVSTASSKALESPTSSESPVSQQQELTVVESANDILCPRLDGYLETVPEEDEEDEQEEDIVDRRASSTGTFRFKSRSALIRMGKDQEEYQNDAVAQEAATNPQGPRLPPISPSSFDNLTSDGVLSEYLNNRSSLSPEDQGVDTSAPPSVAGLKEFWAKASGPAVQVPSVTPPNSLKSVSSVSASSSSIVSSTSPTAPVSSSSCSSSTSPTAPTSPILPSSPLSHSGSSTAVEGAEPSVSDASADQDGSSDLDSEEMLVAAEPTTELAARVMAVKSALSRSTILAEAIDGAQVQTNSNGVILATRYPPKRTQHTDGTLDQEKNQDVQPGIDMEHHMPVKDLRKRWEEIYRLGM
ncbi:hypothetical protein B0O80DRAFT_428418 [Mortierella sp. GBAus27b]|nr:hypothetical protein BGX31_007978 [Mortierella sp. GBA43]KAI8350437.1 hypothetical protein B0O80DRAFT_428418 [Mortierella sp. GBAus27b]